MGQESPPGAEEDLHSEACAVPPAANDDRVYAFLVEECILFAFDGKNAKCPKHGDLYLGQIAPDTVFLDLDDRLRIPQEGVKRGGLIGLRLFSSFAFVLLLKFSPKYVNFVRFYKPLSLKCVSHKVPQILFSIEYMKYLREKMSNMPHSLVICKHTYESLWLTHK